MVALFLARELKNNEQMRYLVYNNTLNDYIEHAIENNEEIKKVKSNEKWHRWFRDFYKKKTLEEVPKKSDDDDFIYDWNKIIPKLGIVLGKEKPMDTLVIDEGQDMPPEFYYFVSLISKSFYIFADENQIITEHNSTIKQIEENLGNNVKKYSLRKNHRNTLQIAELASKFYTGLPGGIPEFPQKRNGDKPKFYTKTEKEQLIFIKNYCRANTKKNIGIFLPDNKLVKQFYMELKKSFADRLDYYHSEKYYDCPECFEGKLVPRKSKFGDFYACDKWRGNDPKSCNYKWTKRYNNRLSMWRPKRMNYQPDSIHVMTYNSAKGLEYDTVIIPHLKNDYFTVLNDKNKMKFYVITSRARTELILMKNGTFKIDIFDNIPDINKYITYN